MQGSQLRRIIRQDGWLLPLLSSDARVPSTTLNENVLNAVASWAERCVHYISFDEWDNRFRESEQNSQQAIIGDMPYSKLYGVRTTEHHIFYHYEDEEPFAHNTSPDGRYAYPLGYNEELAYQGLPLVKELAAMCRWAPRRGEMHFDAVVVTHIVGVKLVRRGEPTLSQCEHRRYHICKALPKVSPELM
jgi:hypothetical protein